MEENPPKVNKWDGNAVKNALDDAVKDVLLNNFNYVECHKLLDGRLFISCVAVGFSLFALAWDNFYPFPESRLILLICVVSYFLMMGVLTWYTSYLELGIFCTVLNQDVTGIDPDDVWYASSSLKRFDNHYQLSLSLKCGKTCREKEATKTLPIENYFDESGRLLYDRVATQVLHLHSDIGHKKN